MAEGSVNGMSQPPIVVVGSGPAGVRLARELLARDVRRRVLVLGGEACEPYDRVRLSSALAGECNWQMLSSGAGLPSDPRIEARYGTHIVSIDRVRRCVIDAQGQQYPYSALVLATGSRPHVPQIPGVELPGVFCFRDLRDAERLLARRVRSRRTVVLGGGLLGLEAARAMRRFRTELIVVEHADRLMPRQLDAQCAATLRGEVEKLGIHVVLDDGAAEICGHGAVESVRLRSGARIPCDTVIVATGIVPNVQLALASGLPIGRGIKVDDRLRTQDPDIYAIGECAEHRGVVYGLVAPCFEQAAVAASVIDGRDVGYLGSLAATRLKVLATPVFSAGLTPDMAPSGAVSVLRYREDRVCRTLVLRGGRLVGAQAVGDWSELPRVLEAVQRERPLGWLARWRFRRSGLLWPAHEQVSVAAWPANATVCNCTGVTRGELSAAVARGCASRDALAQCTRASTVCGSCLPLLDELLGATAQRAPVWGARPLLAMTAIAALAALLIALLPGLPYVPSWAATELRWDRLWRDGVLKQITGFSLLGLAALGLLLSLRKRMTRLRLGSFPLWRSLHVLLGIVAIGALLLHTGGRVGHGINAWLMSVFLATIGAGGVAGALIALEHRLAPAQAKRLRGQLTWLHILTFWPLPVLLGFHVLKIYYF